MIRKAEIEVFFKKAVFHKTGILFILIFIISTFFSAYSFRNAIGFEDAGTPPPRMKTKPTEDHNPVDKNTIQQPNFLNNPGFEDGFTDWGTGQYEKKNGLFWGRADASLSIDYSNVHGGKKSAKLNNKSPSAPHVYKTICQRINNLKKYHEYEAEFWVKARNLTQSAFFVTTDMGWNQRKGIDKGTYEWRKYTHIFNTGDLDYVDFRMVIQNKGIVWIDDISFRQK